MKSRILHIKQYLEIHSDEQHPVTIDDIIFHLKINDIEAGRKSVKSDIVQLIEFGYDIVVDTENKPHKYFIGNNKFDLAELKLLADAVRAAQFISSKKSEKLINKITSFTSVYNIKNLERHLYIDKQSKTTNERVIYTVDMINTAINNSQKITFKYYDYDGNKKKIYKHNRQNYVFSPYFLIWNNDCYYAVGHSDNHGKIVNFRVDRIAAPKLTEKQIIPKPENLDISMYTKSVFQMYIGTEEYITLKCENSVMKSIIDKFGEKAETTGAPIMGFVVPLVCERWSRENSIWLSGLPVAERSRGT